MRVDITTDVGEVGVSDESALSNQAMRKLLEKWLR
jgi:hypothetical protein